MVLEGIKEISVGRQCLKGTEGMDLPYEPLKRTCDYFIVFSNSQYAFGLVGEQMVMVGLVI